jgi:Mlc titration factor MtfA (ptsG expression regulator)
MNGAAGLKLTDFMRLSIAAQAALPILELPPALYEGWDEIIVYPAGFEIPRARADDAGVVHEYIEEAAGEAWDGGPVILSWADLNEPAGAFNVAIHEFAHKLDLRCGLTGEAPGLPPGIKPRRWRQTLQDAYESYARWLGEVENSIPPDVDPESPRASPWYDRLPLDPYAATDLAEFFAVSSEQFFVGPEPLAEDLPRWYELLKLYYRQDTLKRFEDYP